jgi:hypothetical protein
MTAGELFDGLTPAFDMAHGGARATDPETSHLAAAEAIGRKAHHQRLTLAALLAADDGLTDFELAAITGVQQTSIGKRRGELRDAGLVRQLTNEDGITVRRPSPSNSPSIVWTLTAAGEIEAESTAA